ncbi:hypothetical protein ACFVWR_17745 [Leifsonia sp. NPDC058292]|uniref:hypothetical protein n=1 Tax=Leifsonia sp. NPDC058292 TaxID=3346428 RepID=UPI0036D9C04D
MTAIASIPTRTKARTTPAARVLAALSGIAVVIALAGCTGGVETVDLTKGFPASAVPIAEGDIIASAKSGVAYNATVQVEDEKAQQAALSQLKKKGFVVIGTSAATNSTAYSLASAEYSVRLGFEKSKGTYSVTYGVSPRGATSATSTPTDGK